MEILFNNQQSAAPFDQSRLCEAIRRIVLDAGMRRGEISVAIVDDAQMQRLNARFLNHDFPTDVLSFVHEAERDRLEGEIIVSGDTASRQANNFSWRPEDELLLYVIHGALHLVGQDDHNDEDAAKMRDAERRYLKHFGLQPRFEEEDGIGRTSKSPESPSGSEASSTCPTAARTSVESSP